MEDPNDKKQSRKFFITENNPSEEDIERYKQIECQWMCICKEHQDEENQTPHIHIAIVFKGARRIRTIKKLFPRAHIDIMNGSPQDCKTYMTKEDTEPFEKGEMPKSRQQSQEESKKKWDNAYNAALQGNFDEIPRDMWIRYQNSFKQIYYDNQKDKSMDAFGDKELKNHFLWLWGPTGTGKSHTAHRIAKELAPEEEPYLKDLNKWWNGYNHQKVTIIEEADPKRCEHLASFFKKWCDKWNFTAECKGSVIPACRPEYIIVTSNYDIDTCFPDPSDSVPMHRRMTEQQIVSRDYAIEWPSRDDNEELRRIAVRCDKAAPGNTSPSQPESSSPGLEPPSKKKRVVDDSDESGLIGQPPILENTPSDL